MAGQRTESPILVQASAAQTATGQTTGVEIPLQSLRLAVMVNVTAVSGTTPSNTFSVQWSNDNINWAVADTADSFTAITATGNVVKDFTVKAKYFRVVYTISGTTPSFTFSVTAFGV